MKDKINNTDWKGKKNKNKDTLEKNCAMGQRRATVVPRLGLAHIVSIIVMPQKHQIAMLYHL